MPLSTSYLFIVAMDVDADKEALFNEVYDQEHIPHLLKVPGVRHVMRGKGQPFAMALAGERVEKSHEGPSYYAMYEIDSPDVVSSSAWLTAVEQGRWPGDVRPFTRNRRHLVLKMR